MTEADLRRSVRALLETLQAQGKILFGQHSSAGWHYKDSEGKWQMAVNNEGLPPLGQPDFWVFQTFRQYPNDSPNYSNHDWYPWPTALFLELKKPGGKLKPEQEAWLERAKKGGALTCVAETFEQVKDALREVGVEV